MIEVIVELGLKTGVVLRRVIGGLDRQDQRHQGLGDKTPAIDPEMAARVRPAAKGVRCLHRCPLPRGSCTTKTRRSRRKSVASHQARASAKTGYFLRVPSCLRGESKAPYDGEEFADPVGVLVA